MAAPMPATVVKILVQAGDRVEKGAPVVMLEAMKMELAVRAAQSGTVRSVNCKPGELVQPGVQLVEIEE
jgi:3-methylcrotonyl-CoA carboxylase alpha subunit